MPSCAAPMDQFARLPVAVRRWAYRLAYAGLSVYWFIRRPRSDGVKCVLTDGERLLLVRHTYGQSGWDLPGGNIKSGEPPERAARREMQEELGIAIDGWTSLGQVRARYHGRRDVVHCYRAELHGAVLTVDLGELYEARWFNRAQLPPDLARYVRPVLSGLPSPS